MNCRRAAARTLLLVVTGLLPACIDIREEYWLQADGGGHADLSYAVPALVARMHGGEAGLRAMIAGFLANTPAITSSSYTVATTDNRTRVALQIGFDSVQELKAAAAGPSLNRLPAAASHLAGTILTQVHGRTLDFTRTISPAKALPEAVFLPASQVAGHRLNYIVHLPAAATQTNATRVMDDGRTLVWDIPLDQALLTPVVTRFQLPMPLPWQLVTTLAVPLAALGGGAWLVSLARRRKPLTTASDRGCRTT